MPTLLVLASCPGPDPYVDRYGTWQVNSVDNPSSTGSLSEPWIKLSKDALVTFVYHDSTQWRRCTLHSGTTFLVTWPDGEVYHMTVTGALPYSEDGAVSTPCFN